MSNNERRQRGLELFEEMLGPEQTEQAIRQWERICPDLGEYILEFVAGDIWSRPGLDRRTKSLVTIAVTAAIGRMRPLELNLRIAKRNGASREEIVETLLHIAPYAGMPAAWDGLALAREVFDKEDEASADAPKDSDA